MNIEFEWIEWPQAGDPQSVVFSCWLGRVQLGGVNASKGKMGEAWFGESLGKVKRAMCNFDILTVAEGKRWVEQQAREWLAEVSGDQRLLALANAFSEAYAKAMADQGNTQAWLKVHEAWCAYDDAQKKVMG